MKHSKLSQSEKTKEFIEACEALILSGEVKNYAEIIDRLDWDKSMFSNVKNGRRNVPNYIFKKFTEVFHPETKNATHIMSGEAGKEISSLTIEALMAKAAINVLLPEVANVLAKLQDKEFSEVYTRLVRARQREFEALYEEFLKQRAPDAQ